MTELSHKSNHTGVDLPFVMDVPLVDLRASLCQIKEKLFDQFEMILDGMQLFLGPSVQEFETEFSAYCKVKHGVAVSSGTDALYAALRACEIGPGDEVIAPSLTFFATIEAIIHTGATPVLVDVEPITLTIDSKAVRNAITPATKAILPVHLYGHPADMDAINQIAKQFELRVIEDAAQAHGAKYKGRLCGSMGDAGCFSFYYTKNLGAFGEAGFVTTNDSEIAERIRLYRDHGRPVPHCRRWPLSTAASTGSCQPAESQPLESPPSGAPQGEFCG